MTQKEAFIHYFQAMDIDMLEQILPDDCICFGATKQTFVQRLRLLWGYGTVEDRKGIFKVCKSRLQKNLYLFYTGRTGNPMKFLVICNKSGEIRKLKNARTAKTRIDFDDFVSSGIYFGDDEKIGFFPSEKYHEQLKLAKTAYEEIKHAEKIVLCSAGIASWLKKYRILYFYCVRNYQYFKLKKFRDRYFCYEYLYGQLSHANEAKQAIEEYYSHSYRCINDWYEKYYRLGFCKSLHFSNDYIDVDYTTNFVKSIENIYYRGEDFIVLYDFSELFMEVFETYSPKTHGC